MNVSSKLCRKCKKLKAAERLRMPYTLDLRCCVLATKTQVFLDITLDCYHIAAYIYLRCKSPGCRIFDQARCQGRTSQGARSPQSTPAAGSRPLVPRSTASSMPAIWCRSNTRCCAACGWRVPTRPTPPPSLASPARRSIRPKRTLPAGLAGLSRQATRPEERPQADPRGHGVHRGAPGERGRTGSTCAGTRVAGRTRYHGPSPQYRTRPGAEKTTYRSFAATDPPSPVAVSLYESLRTEVLQGTARPRGTRCHRLPRHARRPRNADGCPARLIIFLLEHT